MCYGFQNSYFNELLSTECYDELQQINHSMSSSIELQNNGNIPGETRNEEDEATTILPNRLLLSAIPVSDLGDSLDSRHLSESLNMSQSLGGGFLKHHMR